MEGSGREREREREGERVRVIGRQSDQAGLTRGRTKRRGAAWERTNNAATAMLAEPRRWPRPQDTVCRAGTSPGSTALRGHVHTPTHACRNAHARRGEGNAVLIGQLVPSTD